MARILYLSGLDVPRQDQPRLETIQLNPFVPAFIPFTEILVGLDTHRLAQPPMTRLVACNGENCDLCDAGYPAVETLLLPVYGPATKRVQVVRFPRSLRPPSLGAQLVTEIQPILEEGRGAMVYLFHNERQQPCVRSLPLHDDDDHGTGVIKAFCQWYEVDPLAIAATVTHKTNAQFWQIRTTKGQPGRPGRAA